MIIVNAGSSFRTLWLAPAGGTRPCRPPRQRENGYSAIQRNPLLTSRSFPGSIHRFANTTDVVAAIEDLLGLGQLSMTASAVQPFPGRRVRGAEPTVQRSG
jgi:hypothetical protein